jgi:hypothetical protein
MWSGHLALIHRPTSPIIHKILNFLWLLTQMTTRRMSKGFCGPEKIGEWGMGPSPLPHFKGPIK